MRSTVIIGETSYGQFFPVKGLDI